ncbi:MAG: C25 family cysteine peptidase [Candidatus Nanoarchaeia archaeon]
MSSCDSSPPEIIYSQEQNQPVISENTQPEIPTQPNKISENIPTWCEKDCPVLIFVDSPTYNILKEKVDRFVTDVKKDVKAEVFLEVVSVNENPTVIRNKIQDAHKNNNLQGVIFVGDVPIVQSKFVDIYNPEGTLAANDKCYMEVIKNQIFTKTEEGWTCKTDTKDNKYLSPEKMWHGRILPPQNDKIKFLSDYLDRNHAYRNEQLSFEKGSLFYYDTEFIQKNSNPELFASYFAGLDTLYDNSKVQTLASDFTKEQQAITEGKNGITQNTYLNKLKESREFVIVNQHGLTNFHEPNIRSEQIKEAVPQALAYLFYSCSVGGFQDQNYLAGNYLFSGKGLIAIASSSQLLVGFPEGELRGPRDAGTYKFFKLLNSGATFGEAWLVSDLGSGNLLGDPTLRLRPQKIASIKLELNKIKLNSLHDIKSVKIYNLGQKNLENLNGYTSYNHAYDPKQLETEVQTPSELLPTSNKEILIAIEQAPQGNFNGQIHLVYAGEDGYWIHFLPISGTIN